MKRIRLSDPSLVLTRAPSLSLFLEMEQQQGPGLPAFKAEPGLAPPGLLLLVSQGLRKCHVFVPNVDATSIEYDATKRTIFGALGLRLDSDWQLHCVDPIDGLMLVRPLCPKNLDPTIIFFTNYYILFRNFLCSWVAWEVRGIFESSAAWPAHFLLLFIPLLAPWVFSCGNGCS